MLNLADQADLLNEILLTQLRFLKINQYYEYMMFSLSYAFCKVYPARRPLPKNF